MFTHNNDVRCDSTPPDEFIKIKKVDNFIFLKNRSLMGMS